MHATQALRIHVFLLVALVLVVALFAPMVAVHVWSTAGEGAARAAGGEEVTVGIAVILRASARRLLRGGASSLMRTTVGALGRTSARAMTRRFVKFAGRLLFSGMVQESVREGAQEPASSPPSSPLLQVVALGLGYAGLCLSFLGVLAVAPERVADAIVAGSGLSTTQAVLLAGAPLLVYAALHQVIGRPLGVRARYRTELDGLLLQAYFTGAGSFLPLTTDVDYEGTERAKRNLAVGSLAGMFAMHLAFLWLGRATGSPALAFLAPAFLVYAFVYCFPIKPLEGHYVWASSKLLWLLVTLPVLAAFLSWMPPAFGEIL